jgi:hypothetical protein
MDGGQDGWMIPTHSGSALNSNFDIISDAVENQRCNSARVSVSLRVMYPSGVTDNFINVSAVVLSHIRLTMLG